MGLVEAEERAEERGGIADCSGEEREGEEPDNQSQKTAGNVGVGY